MKKRLLLVLAALLCFGLLVPAAGLANEPVKIIVHGEYVQSDVSPFIYKDRTMVPVRVISEYLGYRVSWNDVERSVAIFLPGKKNSGEGVFMRIGDPKIYFGEGYEPLLIDVAPLIRNDRTFLPLRALAELFGEEVDWDPYTRTVYVGPYLTGQ